MNTIKTPVQSNLQPLTAEDFEQASIAIGAGSVNSERNTEHVNTERNTEVALN
ncbi:hypothetical protein [Shewanella colwelliana]|uniref:hypothetical protein n=1 Tax=Shewanella colwelliana TaxID=23 RepID=UPI0022AF5B5F|nr:hypothetical protein [Shewanella colwelliana]MCZ4337690.1 hypothetical protein [Shewanella colwelliana]